jgi:hypothetical protein
VGKPDHSREKILIAITEKPGLLFGFFTGKDVTDLCFQ